VAEFNISGGNNRAPVKSANRRFAFFASLNRGVGDFFVSLSAISGFLLQDLPNMVSVVSEQLSVAW